MEEGTRIVRRLIGAFLRLTIILSPAFRTDRPPYVLKITDAVHQNGSYIFCQIWAMGRPARTALLQKENPNFRSVSASAIPLKAFSDDVPHELTKEGMFSLVEDEVDSERRSHLSS